MFGFRYLSKEERANERLLREAWGESESHIFSQPQKSGKAWRLVKRGRVLGLSKMLVKSLIFAIAGILATLVFRLINRRKAMQLKLIEEEEKRQEQELMQQEWDRIQASKLPLLQITPVGQADNHQQKKR